MSLSTAEPAHGRSLPSLRRARSEAPLRTGPAATASPALLRRFTLAFTDPVLERRYQLAVGREGLGGYRLSCAFGALLWLIATQVVPVTGAAAPWLPLVVGLIGASMNIGGLLASRWTTTVDRQNGLATPIAIVNGWAALMLADAMGVTEAYAASALILIGVYFFVARVRFVYTLIRVVGLLAGFAVLAASTGHPGSLALDAFILVAALCGVLIALYRLELAARRLFRNDLTISEQTDALANENAESERLLLNILPAAIAQRLRDGADRIADEVPDATVLFADLVGFTPIARRQAASELVSHLDELFSRFDALAAAVGVEKIKTIGDAYMAVGGIPEPVPLHPQRMVELGLGMIEVVEGYAAESGLPFALRVGVHTGPLVAGVIGTHKFSYDLWGDTVNVASRLESGGTAGAVHVSETTWLRLGGTFTGTACGPVELKGVGALETWLVRADRPAAAVAA